MNPAAGALVRDNLLTDYFYGGYDLSELAFNHDLALDELMDILESEEFRSRLDRLKKLSEQHAEDILASALPKAAGELVMIGSLNPADSDLHCNKLRYLERECTRKAATAILQPLLRKRRSPGDSSGEHRVQSQPARAAAPSDKPAPPPDSNPARKSEP